MSRATCRGTRTRGEVVDDESRDEPRDVPRYPDMRRRRSNRTCGVVKVVDDEPHDEPRDVPRHPDAWRKQSSRRRAA
jgi:hypothetical protein